MSAQPKALFLADVIETDPKSAAHHVEAAFELRRLHEKCETLTADTIAEMDRIVEIGRLTRQRDALLEALKQFAECELNEGNCASFEVANRRIRYVARAAIAKAEGEKK